jgi:uncharacterized protein
MHIDKHVPGDFCWFELATTDQPDAIEFYTNLFGWEHKDQPIGPTETYTTFQLENRDVAAAYTMRAQERDRGVPPHWMLYIAVENADAAAAKAAAAGGTVVAPAFDVMEHGRMSVISDPTGAMFAVWQGKSHQGTGIKNITGTVVWADLNTPDPERAGRFYSDLFGWKIVAGKDAVTAGPDQYGHIVNGQEMIGGMPPKRQDVPPHWLLYFSVPDCDGAVAETIGGHGRIMMPAMTMEGQRRFAVLTDPQGAAFAIVQEFRK